MIPKSSLPDMSFETLKFLLKNEIEICLELKHENVINCYKVFEDTIAVYFIFELIDGGDLFTYIQTFPNKKIPEYRVIEIFIQILDSLHYIHCEKDVVHKDIKPENFLIYTEGSKLNVKLIDFGFAEKMLFPEQKLKIESGSLPYISPEMIQHKGYDTKSDMFSVGVVLFNMLTGRQPFFGRNDDERRNSILAHEPAIPKEITNQHLIDLLKGLFEKDPEKRLSVQEAKLHPWIQDYINLHQQQTVKKEFVPNLSNSKNLNNLVMITNIKNIVWRHFLINMNFEVAYKVRNYLFDNFSDDKDNNQTIQGKFSINYDLFLEAVIKVAENNHNLASKIQGSDNK
jgi:serine/threonine protein kinase